MTGGDVKMILINMRYQSKLDFRRVLSIIQYILASSDFFIWTIFAQKIRASIRVSEAVTTLEYSYIIESRESLTSNIFATGVSTKVKINGH